MQPIHHIVYLPFTNVHILYFIIFIIICCSNNSCCDRPDESTPFNVPDNTRVVKPK